MRKVVVISPRLRPLLLALRSEDWRVFFVAFHSSVHRGLRRGAGVFLRMFYSFPVVTGRDNTMLKILNGENKLYVP